MSGIIEELGLDKMSEQLETKKDVYQIWREYLKRSELYKKGCAWAKNLKYNPAIKLFDFEIQDLRDSFKIRYIINEFWIVVEKELKLDGSIPNIETWKIVKNIVMQNYCFFGDVHTESFDKFWPRAKIMLRALDVFNKADYRNIQSVRLLYEKENKSIIEIIKDLYNTIDNQDQTIERTIEFEMRGFGKPRWDSVAVEIRLTSPLASIKKEVGKIVKKERKKQNIKVRGPHHNYRLPIHPTGSINSRSLLRYLKVYDLKIVKAKKWREVVLHFHPEMNPETDIDWPNTERMYKADLQKARRILKNVENGQFPGRINGSKIPVGKDDDTPD
jgi:hypothetical protein